MQYIKPLTLGVLPRPFQHGGKPYLAVGALAFFDFDHGGRLLPDGELHPWVAVRLGPLSPIDEGLPKPNGEFLVHGDCHAPGGQAVTRHGVSVRVGSLRRELVVTGDRDWLDNRITNPRPFTTMPLGWERAFGGPNQPKNPLGKGMPTLDEAGMIADDPARPRPLPNVEDPDACITAPNEIPDPAGLGPTPTMWPQRQQYIGTYTADSFKENGPGFAPDMDPRFFQAAQPRQWFQEPLRGDEDFEIQGMDPDASPLRGSLPGMRVRCFLTTEDGPEGADRHRELPMHPETLWLFPEPRRAVLVYRGCMEAARFRGVEVAQILVAYERLTDAPRTAEHYLAVMQRRDKRGGRQPHAIEMMRQVPLIPEGERSPWLEMEATGREEMGGELVRVRKSLEGIADNLATLREEMVARNLPLDDFPEDPVYPEPPDLETMELPEKAPSREEIKAQVDAKIAEDMERARTEMAKQGHDFDQAYADSHRYEALFSDTTLMDQVEKLRGEGHINDQQYALLQEESPNHPTKRAQSIHHYPPFTPRTPEERAAKRREAEAALGRGRSLAGLELCEADLRGMDLGGVDLSRCALLGADLSGANLAGAVMEEALLARANLTGANLEGARAIRINLGHAILVETNLAGADLTGGVLTGARAHRARLHDACLDGVECMETDFTEADLGGVRWTRPATDGLILDRARLHGFEARKATFTNYSMAGADFTGAVLDGTNFLTGSAPGACFAGASAVQCMFSPGTDLRGADFRDADLSKSNLSRNPLRKARFDRALLEETTLMGADAVLAVFYCARGLRATFSEADLRGADFRAALLPGARFQLANLRKAVLHGANLYQCDFAAADMDEAVLAEAYRKGTLLA